MGLNDTPKGERLHIAFFGKRNAGKSSLVNALTGQELSIVSDIKGTTTDPVYKAMELLPLGPVMMVDTPGLDDEGELGKERVKRAKSVLNKTDIALVVVDSKEFLEKDDLSFEKEILSLIEEKKLPG
ncbi:MAG: GTPase, partial [Acetivibrio ethanolgignens]